MKKVQIYIAGDSTVSDCPPNEEPRAGWGQVLQSFFNENVKIHNLAVGGRSSKSFIDEGRLDSILDNIQANDYLFIQFGHNDQKLDERRTEPYQSYQTYLSEYIDGARDKGAIPVLFTSMHRRTFDENGHVTNSLGDYPKAMISLAEEKSVKLIDLWTESKKIYESLGPEASKKLFIWLEQGEHSNYPTGISDDTHFCEYGANIFAQFITEEIKRNIPDLAIFLK
jgi:lysophospholipase L1-like esterase